MFSPTDTIVAIATPPGRGGIGVVRISGADAHAIVAPLLAHRDPLEPRRATFTHATFGEITDQVIATYFPAPHSYTGEDVVELSAHGSPVVLRAAVEAAIGRGARLAEPGEFTLRAFLNGRIDLAQAEAVADLVDAVTPLQARAAFDQLEGTLTRSIAEIDAALFDLIARLEASVDFPDEGYHFIEPTEVCAAIDRLIDRVATLQSDARRGRLLREGFQVAIVGKPNVGKSSLFNRLVGAARAIVTDVPGTTRDLVTEVVDLDGYRVTFVDTAGLRETEDAVEAEGVRRSRAAVEVADLTVRVVEDDDQLVDKIELTVRNKVDLASPEAREKSSAAGILCVSAKTGEGFDELRLQIARALEVDQVDRDRPSITNVRHATLIDRAHAALCRARQAAMLPEEFVLADLQDARAALEEIAGRRVPEDVLNHIFANFCVGK